MGQGGRALGPFGMPEGGRLAVQSICRHAIFSTLFLAVYGYDLYLPLGNDALPWRVRLHLPLGNDALPWCVRRECYAHLLGEHAFCVSCVIGRDGKEIGLSGGEIGHGIGGYQAYWDHCLILTALRAI